MGTLGALALAALLGVALTAGGCRDGDPGEPAPQAQGVGGSGGGGSSAEDADTGPALPDLAFEELSEGLPTTGTWIGYPLAADFDGDGRADLACSNREEDGYRTWRAPTPPATAWEERIEEIPRNLMYGVCDAGDVDGDGDLDLVLGAHTDGLRVYLNDGDMHWTPSAWTESEEQAANNPELLLGLSLGHIDDDGHLDVFAVSHFEGGLHLFLGDGEGGFTRQSESDALLRGMAFGRCAELVDLDADGAADLVAATNQGLKAWLQVPGESRSWREVSAGLRNPAIGNVIYGLEVASFTGSERPEIAACQIADTAERKEDQDNIGVYQWDAEAEAWKAIDSGLLEGDAYRDLAAADFDGDGHLDLVTTSVESGVVVSLGDGQGGFRPIGRVPGPHGKGRLAVGDFDADGRPDIAVATATQKSTQAGGGMRVFLNRLPRE